MVKHIKVRKRNWWLTAIASIFIGLFCCVMFVGISGTMMMFGLGKSNIVPPLPLDKLFIIGWILVSIVSFLEFVINSDEFTYEAIEHER